MTYFIDIHTHQTSKSNDCISVYNLDLFEKPRGEEYFSAGIHPWDIPKVKNLDEHLKILRELKKHKFFFALGEMGLDKTRENFNQQEDTFKKQLLLAKELKIKAIVIHCVKAFNEVIRILKDTSFDQSIIFHDYNGNESITKELLKRKSYFSYGSSLYRENSQGHKSLKLIPLERIFLETDNTQRDIITIYKKFSELYAISEDETKKVMYQTFENLKNKN